MPKTAGEIARAIMYDARYPRPLDNVERIEVIDEGPEWRVHTVNKRNFYGGGVSMKINKCSSYISSVVFSE